MGFKVDYTKTGMEPINPGEYEVFPVKYDISKANSGNTRVIVNYEIRADVDQPSQGQEIRYDNFTVTDNSMWRFNQASKAAGVPDGMEFNTVKEWADAFMNRSVRVVVEDRTHNGNVYPSVKMFKESQHPLGRNTKDPFQDDGKPIDISDDDMPF